MSLTSFHLSDPRLHFWGVVIVVILFLAGAYDSSDSTPCPACPGHNESARDCLCYHVDTPIKTIRN